MVERQGQASFCRRPGVRGAVPGLEEDLASTPRPRWESVAPRCRVIKWPVRAHYITRTPFYRLLLEVLLRSLRASRVTDDDCRADATDETGAL